MARLRRTRPGDPGIRRVRRGRGFGYVDADGAAVTDPELRARIEALAIPPAWTEVWMCALPNGHIQATGVGAAGRTQSLYRPRWREQAERQKFGRALARDDPLPAGPPAVPGDL